MMRCNGTCFELDTHALALRAAVVPWDSDAFGCPVVAISHAEVKNGQSHAVQADFDLFQRWLDEHGVQIATCRLPHGNLGASMLLESNGFKFIEMVLHPVLGLQDYPSTETGLRLVPADEADVSALAALAQRAFGYERYHVDPRIDSALADLRYASWVRNSFHDASQRLMKVTLDVDAVGLFVVEDKPDGSAYWHLTAVHPDFQGRQLGSRIWMTVIRHHQNAGRTRIRTTISARNSPVLGLYAKLNFRFDEPEMTFHWLREPMFAERVPSATSGIHDG